MVPRRRAGEEFCAVILKSRQTIPEMLDRRRVGFRLSIGPAAGSGEFVNMKEKRQIPCPPGQERFVSQVSGEGALCESPRVEQAISDWKFHDGGRSTPLDVVLIDKVGIRHGAESAPQQGPTARDKGFLLEARPVGMEPVCATPECRGINQKAFLAEQAWQFPHVQEGAAPKGPGPSTECMQLSNAVVELRINPADITGLVGQGLVRGRPAPMNVQSDLVLLPPDQLSHNVREAPRQVCFESELVSINQVHGIRRSSRMPQKAGVPLWIPP